MDGEALLNLRDFSLEYGTNRGSVFALRDVSLSVGHGEIVGIVGESGCGKSSLIGAILRLLPANARTHGEIFFKQRNLYDLAESEMRHLRGGGISVVFQDPMRAHNPVMTIGAQMADAQHREKITRAEKLKHAEHMLRQVGIPEPELRLRQYPHQMSGGMLQRIAIAMALISRPDLLIADEPTTALDATLEICIIDKLRELQQDYGCAIILVSHHLGVIAELCEKVAVMYAGEVVEIGAVKDVFSNPGHPYTRRLLQCDPGRAKRTERLPTISGNVPDLMQLPEGCAFAPRCDKAMPKCKSRPPAFGNDERRIACWLHKSVEVETSDVAGS